MVTHIPPLALVRKWPERRSTRKSNGFFCQVSAAERFLAAVKYYTAIASCFFYQEIRRMGVIVVIVTSMGRHSYIYHLGPFFITLGTVMCASETN